MTARLTRYLTREFVPPLIAGAALFTAVLSFGYFFISSQYLKGVPLGLVLEWIAYQVPDTLSKILPMAVVLMVVVGFGRLSTERELIAMQSGGLSLGRASIPAVVIAVLVTIVAVWMSLWVAPSANVAARSLYWDTLTGGGLQQLGGRTTSLGQGLELYFDGYDTQSKRMRGVRLQQWTGRQATIIFADSGDFQGNTITLTGYQGYTVNYDAVRALDAVPDNDPQAFRAAVQNVFTGENVAPNAQATLEIDTGLSRAQTIAQYADAVGADASSWSSLTRTLHDPKTTPVEKRAARLDLNRKLALPFGNLVLVLAALPFALRYGRSTGTALGVALLIAVAYYLLFFVGLALAGAVPALTEVGVWFANIVFAIAGLLLLRRT